MTVEMRAASAPTAPSSEATPVAFDGVFGWFHPAKGRRGVVLCGAQGFEQMAAHRPWRALAERLAAAGCPTLRFDYPGEGDSVDSDEPRLSACISAVRHAVRFMRETTGVSEIVLVGLRLGASFAVLAAQDETVDRLVLLAPVATARAYQREMRLRARTVGRLPDGSAAPQPAEGLTVGGFHLDAGFLDDLSRIDLSRIGNAPASRVLILAPEAKALASQFEALGSSVETAPLAGLAQLVGDPIFAEVPQVDFARITAFVSEGVVAADTAVHVQGHSRLAGPDWSEEPVRFGSGLFGIQCEPPRPEPGAPTVLFVSTGLTVHSGWGRQTTDLARSLAVEGVSSLRFDLTGIGDSAERTDGRKPLFAPDGFEDIRRAIDHVAGRGGPLVLFGNCSGAYAAFHALCRDQRVDGAMLVNLYCFDWDPDQNLDSVIRQTFGSASTYMAKLKQGGTWRRLLRGDIQVRAIASAIAVRGMAAAQRRISRLFRPGPLGGSVARRIATVRRRGAEVRILYSIGDPGLAALRRHLGRSPGRADRRIGAPVVIVPGVDHNLGSPEAQDLLGHHLRDLLRSVRCAPTAHARASGSTNPRTVLATASSM